MRETQPKISVVQEEKKSEDDSFDDSDDFDAERGDFDFTAVDPYKVMMEQAPALVPSKSQLKTDSDDDSDFDGNDRDFAYTVKKNDKLVDQFQQSFFLGT